MGGSEEYLANLGIDTSDVDRAVNQTITILGHLSNQFDDVSGRADKAAAALGKTTAEANEQAAVAERAASATRGWAQSMASVYKSQFQGSQKNIYDDYMRQQEAYNSRREQIAAQNRQSLIQQERDERTMRQRELDGLRQSIQARYAEADAVNQQAQNLPRLRYALYDVSSALAITGAGMLALSVATAATSIQFERQFAEVERTSGATGAALDQLRGDFERLYASIPVSFSDLTDIGALGGQLNIAESRLASFTESVAKFAATSDVSTEQTATAFGRLDQLLPDVQGDYEGLSDSILKVGVNSVATESQIISITTQLAGVATTAGLTSKQLIALSGALASVGVAPELARGAITRLFSNIDTAIATGGERLSAFAKISGRTAEEFRKDWGSDSFAVIQDTLEGIGSTGSNMGLVLRELGITASRDLPVFQKLAQNTNILADAFDNASNATGETNRQYSIISSTVAEKITVLVNNFTLLVSKLGEASTGLGGLIDVMIGFLQVLQGIAENPVASAVASLVLVIGALGGVLLIALAAMVRFAASALALRTAMAELGVTTAASSLSLSGMTTMLFGTSSAARVATTSVTALSSAMKVLTGVLAALVIIDLAQWFRESIGDISSVDAATQALKDFNEEKIRTDLGMNRDTGNWFDRFGTLAGYDPDTFYSTEGNPFFDLTGLNNIVETTKSYDAALAQLATSGNAEAAAANFAIIKDGLVAQGAAVEDVLGYFPLYASALEGIKGGSDAAGASTEDYASILSDTIKVFTEVQESALGVQNSLYTLGEGLGDSLDFSDATEAGRKNLGNLLSTIDAIAAQTPGDAAAIAGNLQGLFDQLVNGAGVSATQLIFLQQIIAALGAQGGSIGPATIGFNNLFSGIASGGAKAARAAGGAAKQVKTLVDYGNDLGGVFDRAFDLRFGGQQGLDEIASGWSKIRDGIAKTNEEIAKYQAEMQQLTADKAVREYWLSVAEMYGDTLRAGELRAELAGIDAKLASTSGDLAKAQQKGSKTLVGNSDAAIDNRKTVLDLVSTYQDYIKTLAANGANQAELQRVTAQLKQDFLAQGAALGYSSSELQVYAAAFGDVSTAIARVPRNITVAFNGDPALQAANEFMAKLKSSVGGGVTIPVSVAPDRSGLAQQLKATRDTYQALLNAAYSANGGNGNAHTTGLQAAIRNINNQLSAMGYRKGTAWTGSGDPNEIAGFVHNREAVLNERGTRVVGSEFVNAANQGRNPWQYAPPAPAASRSSGPSIVVLDQAQYLGLVEAMAESGGHMPSASTLQGVVNALNSRTGDLGGK